MDAKQRRFLRELCLQSLYHFVKIIIGYSKQGRDITTTLHKPILDFIQDDSIKRKGLLMPRGFLKSTCVTKSKPLWDWLRSHEERILLANETFTTAKMVFMSFIKQQLEQNELLHFIYPESKMSDQWKRAHRWSSEEIDLPRKGIYSEPTFSCIGVGGAAQGRHFTREYLDDLIGKAARDSAVVRQDTDMWFRNVRELLAQPDPTKPNASFIYLIGTHWSPGDLYCGIMDSDTSYQWKKIPAEDDYGNPTWPDKLDREEIERMKAHPTDYILFYTQYQNNPLNTDLTDFKKDWLKYFQFITIPEDDNNLERTGVQFEHDKHTYTKDLRELEITTVIDPAVSSEQVKGAARTAIVTVGRDPETSKKCVLEAWAKKIGEPNQLFNKIFEVYERFKPNRWKIETAAQQMFILKSIRNACIKEGIPLSLTELPAQTGKDAKLNRIKSLQEDFVKGDILILDSQRDLIGEYLAFPLGTTKDIMDALSWHKLFWRQVDTKELNKKADQRFNKYLMGRNPYTGY